VTKIRIETPDDQADVRKLHLTAFPGPEEADLVDRLRGDGDAVISLVATDGDVLVGHVMFSRMSAPFRALGLAPVAVLPDWRGKGIAARLIENGITQAQKSDWAGIFVLGEPDYYQRFGFSVAKAEKFESAYAGPYLMALALRGSDLPCPSGRIDYASAFTALG
jgi:putative acetyltransferase